MAVPKRKTSKRTRGQRNSHAALEVPQLVRCDNCGYKRPPHRVCPNCGHYAKREVVAKD
ncbi:MAG TPA: 50S ribosomal protein L32 [Planctomycetota bacterium]|jgi:large subunit ribosomal protein L32|nr:50S ribosomal protein L32 [Planctomycetota bacterium]